MQFAYTCRYRYNKPSHYYYKLLSAIGFPFECQVGLDDETMKTIRLNREGPSAEDLGEPNSSWTLDQLLEFADKSRNQKSPMGDKWNDTFSKVYHDLKKHNVSQFVPYMLWAWAFMFSSYLTTIGIQGCMQCLRKEHIDWILDWQGTIRRRHKGYSEDSFQYKLLSAIGITFENYYEETLEVHGAERDSLHREILGKPQPKLPNHMSFGDLFEKVKKDPASFFKKLYLYVGYTHRSPDMDEHLESITNSNGAGSRKPAFRKKNGKPITKFEMLNVYGFKYQYVFWRSMEGGGLARMVEDDLQLAFDHPYGLRGWKVATNGARYPGKLASHKVFILWSFLVWDFVENEKKGEYNLEFVPAPTCANITDVE